MGIFDFFRPTKKQDSQIKDLEKQRPPKHLVILPEYNMYFEFLELVKNKREEHLFYGNTDRVPKDKRDIIKSFYEQCMKDCWLYVTEGEESVVNSFTKNDFTKILKSNNLSAIGNKADMVKRIADNLGLEKFNEIGEIINRIKLTDLGITKLNEYKSKFSKQYDSFKQDINNLFASNKLSDACYLVTVFKESHPFNNVGASLFISYTGNELFDICKAIKNNDILELIGIPEVYREPILITMCMYYSFGDFDYKLKIKETCNDFEEMLIKSVLVKNKEFPYIDFQDLIRGYYVK